MASGTEVSTYFEAVMRDTFLPSGRVQYFPSCNYLGNCKFESETTGKEYEVKVHKKIVDCTYLKTSVPATHTPNFDVAEGAVFIPINELPNTATDSAQYVIIGGGKIFNLQRNFSTLLLGPWPISLSQFPKPIPPGRSSKI